MACTRGEGTPEGTVEVSLLPALRQASAQSCEGDLEQRADHERETGPTTATLAEGFATSQEGVEEVLGEPGAEGLWIAAQSGPERHLDQTGGAPRLGNGHGTSSRTKPAVRASAVSLSMRPTAAVAAWRPVSVSR